MYGSRVKWSNPGKGVAPSPTPWCSKLSKREPSGHPRLWSPTLLFYLFIQNIMICVPPKWIIKERQALGLDSGMPGGIWKIKKTLVPDLFLTHNNPDLEVIVASDASSYGVEACILHKMTDGTLKPITYASRALLLAEKIFANRKRGSSDYLRCLKVPPLYLRSTLHSTKRDHKPLLTIFCSKKVFLRIQPTDCRDGVQSC